jgi:Fic family protein
MPGEFRRDQNRIGSVGIATATFVPPPVPEMNAALDAFEKYLHAPSELPALVRFALIHY